MDWNMLVGQTGAVDKNVAAGSLWIHQRSMSLIAENPARVRQVDAVANTPLHLAVAANNLQMVRLLVEEREPSGRA